MIFQLMKTSLWRLPTLVAAVVLLAAASCQGDPEVAAGSTLQNSPAPALFDPAPQPPPQDAKPAAPGSAAAIGGKWVARSADHRFTIELLLEDQGLRGSVRAADGSVTPINIGVFSGDAFLFETGGDRAGWLWSGELSSEGLKGHRENVQTGAVEEFTAQRPE
jgi:hypothetical protein